MDERNTSYSGDNKTYEMWMNKNAANQVRAPSPVLLKKTANGKKNVNCTNQHFIVGILLKI